MSDPVPATPDELAVKLAEPIHERIAAATEFGGFLRCERCGKGPGSLTAKERRFYYSEGWPRCCGYTMRWWTQRQIDAGEVPDV